MDEELGVKAPVTRLRRRLSTEAEGAKSPLTPSTPTKKRSAKLAKPVLELIDEHVTESEPKQAASRTLTKDVEPAEEKPVTPSRRSTRIRSNTSLLMEATQKIVADSPRAKRALRRNSQIGSDTESATTPARRTRTRKDSTSSVEKLAVTNSNEKIIAQVAEAISEEPEKEISKDNLNSSQNSTPIRKSPRLNKKGKNTTTDEQQKDENKKTKQNDNANSSKLTEDTSSSLNGLTTNNETTSNTHDNTDDKPESKYYEIQNLSPNSAKHTNEITGNTKKTTGFNKTVSAIEELHNDNGNRKRTKSWTTITANNVPAENINSQTKFASGDSILENIDIKSPNKSINKSASIYNTSIENKENIILKLVQAKNASNTIKILEKTPIKDIQSIVFMEDSDSNCSSGKLIIDINNDGKGEKNNGGDQCVPVLKQATPKRLASESFVVEPMDIDETIPENVTINDFSDKSNSSKDESNVPDLKQSSPFSNEKSSDINKSSNKAARISSISLQQESNNSKRKSSITASEENNDYKNALDRSSLNEKTQRKSSISILYENDNFTEKSNKSKRKSSLSKVDSNNDKRKSSANFQVEDDINESTNKSKRKSVSETETQNLEKSTNENKSTLVLSQFKDVSANETSNVSKSPSDTKNEFSKSVNTVTKEADKNNQRNYLTSTPLHQKPLQKLAMQINTSIISPNIESKNTSKANKSKTPVNKVSVVSHDSDSSEDSDEDLRDKSKVIDDEAEEASDDYESGDSRDAEEKQYEKDHEITEKGETLESETNLSDESDDYEKDSFIVSSDEEDDALLSGSGDDLSLTDNELKMTTKSKNKFDERKRKEQKNASREMYEARHQLNESNKSSKTKPKKSKGNKLESSASEPEEDQPKKKNRLRIDSSQDVSMNNSDADGSVCVKKKKTKRLSESVPTDNPNENEITIQNQSVVEKCDPLAVAIKQEPKTPLKDFNMSTVQINDNIELVQVDTNTSVINPNETSDPLQATLAHVDEESDSDISENMEIKENYDSVLQNLSKANNKSNKVKTRDTSLNLNKKAKDKIKDPIIDQLNLTQTKKSKKVKAQIAKDNSMEKSVNKNKTENDKQDDGENSDSIDMRLLFPEDSNDSEVNASKFNSDKNEEPADEFINLKRTEAKTNLRESIGEPEDLHLSFFIDTKGAYEDMDITENSAKKNKKKHKLSLSMDNVEDNLAAPEETSLNDSLKKKKKKNKSFDMSQTDKEPVVNLLEVSSRYEQSNLASEETTNNSMTNEKKKKKKNKSHDDSQIDGYTASEETPTNVSVKNEKKKKNKSQLDVSQIVEDEAPEETPINVSLKSEKKKKKNKSHLDVSQIVEDAEFEETPIDVSIHSDKKKKKNKSYDISLAVGNIAPEETYEDVAQKREKKKKKIKSLDVFQAVDNAGEESDEAPLEVTYKSEKKTDNPEPIEDDDDLNKSKNKFKKKKKKNKKNHPQTDMNTDQGDEKAKKRKRDQSSPIADVAEDDQMSKSQKKKKLLQNDEGGNFTQGCSTNKLNKRKALEASDVHRNPKVFKGNFFEKIHVARLPESIVDQLDDPRFEQPPFRKSKKHQGMAMSTEPFIVEDGPRRKNKPSNYLEQSICLNDSNSPVKQKKKNKNPKVLPFTPTVVTSGKGYTSKFKINVLPEEIQFVAQSSDATNFRNEYLSKQRAKKLRVESFKKHRNHKLAKF